MIHITKSKTGYQVIAIASNSEVLSTSEVLKSKRNCWSNIASQAEHCFFKRVMYLQDDTLKKPKVEKWVLEGDGWWLEKTNRKPEPKYIPGRNPKRKAAKKKYHYGHE